MTIKIISHNAYWFQGHPYAGSAPGAPNQEVLQRLTALYREAGGMILCLQEMQSEEAAKLVAVEMGMDFLYAPGGIYSQYGSMIAASSGLQSAERAPLLLERSHVVGRVSLSFGTLGIATIHLTSGRQSTAQEGAAARVREISAFLDLYGPETDILTGDFNENPEGEVGHLLKTRGYIDAADFFGKTFVETTTSRTRTDQIWIKARWQSRLIDYGVMVEELAISDIEGKQLLSDHRPVWVTLQR